MPTLAALPALAAADEDRAADEHRAAVAWLLLDDRELFLTFDHFPWFKQATVEAILNLDRPAPQHLRWPDLDVDLAVESIEHPERYPLKSKL